MIILILTKISAGQNEMHSFRSERPAHNVSTEETSEGL